MKRFSLGLAPSFSPDFTLGGTDGDDQLAGGPFHDLIQGNAGNDTIFGGAGDDAIIGGTGDDLLFGDYDDTARMGPGSTGPGFGSDVLIAGPDGATIYGDALGIDVRADASGDSSAQTGDDLIVGQQADPGEYALSMGDASEIVVGANDGSVATLVLGNDTILAGDRGEVYGDVLYASIQDGVGRLNTGLVTVTFGDDVIVGGSSVNGDAFSVVVYASTAGVSEALMGDDLLIITNDTGAGVYGDFNIGSIYKVNFQETPGRIVCGDDTLVGGAGDDFLVGDFGDVNNNGDASSVVSGADTFVFSGAFGNDVVQDFNLGLDRLVFADLAGSAADLVTTYNARQDALVIDATAIGGGTVTLLGIGSAQADQLAIGFNPDLDAILG